MKKIHRTVRTAHRKINKAWHRNEYYGFRRAFESLAKFKHEVQAFIAAHAKSQGRFRRFLAWLKKLFSRGKK